MTHGVLAPQASTFTSRQTVNGSRRVSAPWVRPADWLALTTPGPADQRMVGLAAVFDSDSNFVTVRASAAFKVDWGDGAGWNLYAANTTAEKNLAWADYSSATLTSRGYRQAVVQVEPQSGNLTDLALQYRHSNAPATATTSSVWLDLRIACTGTPTITGNSLQWTPAILEQAEITSPVNAPAYMFYGCSSLQQVPALDTSAGTNFSYMFYGCSSLQQIPALNTSAGTNFSAMFRNCYALQQVPALDTSAGTNFSSMFYSCVSLQQIPALDTSAGTNFSSMFQSCSSLQQVPALDTSAGTNFSYMFNGCYALQQIPALNTSAGTNFSGMFQNCSSLQQVPALDTSAGTNFSSMFYSCVSLQQVPALDTSAGTNFSGMFQNCLSLQTIPSLDTSAGTNFSNMFQGCSSLRRSQVTGTRYAISYATASLSAAALDEIYTNLGTAAGAQTITVTGNWGTAGDTPSIATAKGWSVAS